MASIEYTRMRILGLLGSLLAGSLLYAGGFTTFLPGPLVTVHSDGIVSVDAGNKYLEYESEDEISYSDYRVVQLNTSHRNMRTFGIDYELALLTQEDFARFEKLQDNGECPASFLNEKAEMLLLIVPGDQRRAIQRYSLKSGAAVSLEVVEMEFGYGEVNGIELTAFNPSGFQPVLLKNLQVH